MPLVRILGKNYHMHLALICKSEFNMYQTRLDVFRLITGLSPVFIQTDELSVSAKWSNTHLSTLQMFRLDVYLSFALFTKFDGITNTIEKLPKFVQTDCASQVLRRWVVVKTP